MKELHLQGIAISEGIALAKVCLFNDNRHRTVTINKVSDEDKKHEYSRLERAIRQSSEQLDRIIKDVESRIGLAESKIFVAQKLILEDADAQEQMYAEIEASGTNAEGAVVHVLDKYEARLLDVDDEYIKARATDIGEIRRRILDSLSEAAPALQCLGQPHCEDGKDRIIVARELTPTLTVSIDTKNASGFVTEHGGTLSHAAILAKALGIPAVSGIKNIQGLVYCGTEILVDGNDGNVYIWPSHATIERYAGKRSAVSGIPKMAPVRDPIPDMKIFANINLSQDVDEAIIQKAEGIGLYRTEFEFLAEGRLLGEDEQFERYVRVVKAMNGKPVYFRLLDIGGDKAADFFSLPREANPYLGFRGSRLLLARTDLLFPQVRALARASQYGPVFILYPMIVDLKQFVTLRARIVAEIKGIKTGYLSHGVMFEVPSACLEADAILAEADFASVGSNDLIQYLFAVDRNNEYVAYDYTPDRKVFWSLLESIVRASERTGKPVSVCGEIAGSREHLFRLLETGIKSVSVSARFISDLRSHLNANRIGSAR